MTKPSKYQQDIESALDVALLREKKLQAKVKRLEEALGQHRWIPVSERLPKYIEGLNQSKPIFILDDKLVYIGDYYNGKFEYWSGSWCNTDEPASQKAITHWKPIILPEQALKANKKEER